MEHEKENEKAKVMGLNEIKDLVETKDREVEFRPAGPSKPTGWFFNLRHESHEEVQEVIRVFNSKVRELALKRKNAAYKALAEDHENRLRVAHVSGWRWAQGEDENHPAFSKKELRALLNDKQLGYHIKTFIDEEVGSLEDFLSKSESN